MAGRQPWARLQWPAARGSVGQGQELAMLLGASSQRLYRAQGLPVELQKVQLRNRLPTQCWPA